MSAACVKAWCTIYNCSSLSDVLLGLSPRLSSPCFKSIFLLLRPKLLNETWRRYPGAVLAYKWIMCQVHSPNLSQYLNIISPTALIILDDHVLERRLTGLQCLSHIIDNVVSLMDIYLSRISFFLNILYQFDIQDLFSSFYFQARTELCQRGLDQVFYKVLQPMLWQRKADQVEPVITCLTKLLVKTERGYTRSVEPGMVRAIDF